MYCSTFNNFSLLVLKAQKYSCSLLSPVQGFGAGVSFRTFLISWHPSCHFLQPPASCWMLQCWSEPRVCWSPSPVPWWTSAGNHKQLCSWDGKNPRTYSVQILWRRGCLGLVLNKSCASVPEMPNSWNRCWRCWNSKGAAVVQGIHLNCFKWIKSLGEANPSWWEVGQLCLYLQEKVAVIRLSLTADYK